MSGEDFTEFAETDAVKWGELKRILARLKKAEEKIDALESSNAALEKRCAIAEKPWLLKVSDTVYMDWHSNQPDDPVEAPQGACFSNYTNGKHQDLRWGYRTFSLVREV